MYNGISAKSKPAWANSHSDMSLPALKAAEIIKLQVITRLAADAVHKNPFLGIGEALPVSNVVMKSLTAQGWLQ